MEKQIEKLMTIEDCDIEFQKVLHDFHQYNANTQESHMLINAYEFAKQAHSKQFRNSGEPYLIHPLEVAKQAVEYRTDYTTVCACLLHDVVEDTDYTLEDIEKLFDKDVASIVDGVTKINEIKFSSLGSDAKFAMNVRKLFRTAFNVDIRIIAVKLFDRLHNIRTLQHKKREKQKATAEQTLKVFAPLADAIGANAIKKELQDTCFMYIDPERYSEVKKSVLEITKAYLEEINEIEEELHSKLLEDNIPNQINLRVKNIYSVKESLDKGRQIDGIHDLHALQINVRERMQCYSTLGIVQETCMPVDPDSYFKNYIRIPKTTGYQALHTTFLTPSSHMIQAQIRTNNMALRNSKGIIAGIKKYDEEQLEDLKSHYPIFAKGIEIDNVASSDQEFYEKLCYEVLGSKIYVTSQSGTVYDLPVGANMIDFAFLNCPARAPFMEEAFVNGKKVKRTTMLHNNQLAWFTSGDKLTVKKAWIKQASTTRARRLIDESLQKYHK